MKAGRSLISDFTRVILRAWCWHVERARCAERLYCISVLLIFLEKTAVSSHGLNTKVLIYLIHICGGNGINVG